MESSYHDVIFQQYVDLQLPKIGQNKAKGYEILNQ